MTTEISPLWTVEQLAEYLGVKPRFVYDKVESGDLPAVRLGGGRRLRFRPESIAKWLEENEQ